MISWIQKYFQHHFKTIFAVLLAVTIISFIFTIGASPGIGHADRQVVDRYFFGYNLSLQSDQQRLFGDGQLSFSLNPSYNYSGVEEYCYQRAAKLHLADAWHIPSPTADEIKNAIKAMRAFAGQDGQFDQKSYQKFRDNLKSSPRGNSTTEADILRVISDDVRAEKVQTLLAGPGYVLPAEVKTQLTRADTSWTLATATVDYAAFKPEIKPTDAELKQYFEQSGDRYTIQPRVVVSYIQVEAMKYLPQITITEDEARKYYDANPSRFPKPADVKKADAAAPAATPPADPAADFAAVRSQVESVMKFERAQKMAAKEASDISVALYDAKVNSPESFDKFVAARKLTVKNAPAFTRDAVPGELGGSPEVANQAFRLNKAHAVSDPISAGMSSVILYWRDTQPARKPELAEVKDKVAADYTESERRKRFVELGKTIRSDIEARLKAGESFDKAAVAAAEKAGIKAETKTVAPFTLRTRPQDLDYTALSTLERLEKGKVSDMVMNADKGVIVYAVDKKAPDISDTNPQFIEMRNRVASYNAQIGASAYLQEMVDKELEKSKPKAE